MTEEKPQVDRFKDIARALGCDDEETAFDEKLKGIVPTKQKPKARLKGDDQKIT